MKKAGKMNKKVAEAIKKSNEEWQEGWNWNDNFMVANSVRLALIAIATAIDEQTNAQNGGTK